MIRDAQGIPVGPGDVEESAVDLGPVGPVRRLADAVVESLVASGLDIEEALRLAATHRTEDIP